MVMAMIDTAYDKNAGVRTIIATSLVNIGKKKPALMLHSCHNYLRKHSKVGSALPLFLFSVKIYHLNMYTHFRLRVSRVAPNQFLN